MRDFHLVKERAWGREYLIVCIPAGLWEAGTAPELVALLGDRKGQEGHRLEKAEEAMEGLKSALASGMGALLSSKTFPPSPPPFPPPTSQSFPALLF